VIGVVCESSLVSHKRAAIFPLRVASAIPLSGQETVNLVQNTPRCAFTDDVNYIVKKAPFDKIIYTIAGQGVLGLVL
jgi:hypothetical protein